LPKVLVVSGQTVGFCTAQTDWKKPGSFSQVQPGKNRQFSQARLRILTGSPLECNTTRCDRLKRAQINQLFHHVFISELFGRFQDQTNCRIHLSNACLNKVRKIVKFSVLFEFSPSFFGMTLMVAPFVSATGLSSSFSGQPMTLKSFA
jgi:hypothetical protein